MNNKLYLKMFLFILGIEVIILWISFKNLSIFILWILNTIIILFMFFDIRIDLIKEKIISFIKRYYNKKQVNIEKTNKKIDFNIDILKEFLEPIRYFYLKWGFVLSIIILCLSILDNIIFHKFNLSIFWSIIFFFIWLLLLYKNILDWEIYIWNHIVTNKDIVLILSLTMVFVVYTLLNLFYFYERIFYSLSSWLVFYIVAVFTLDYTNIRLKLFKSIFLYVYLFLTFVSFFIFLYNKIPSIRNYFIVEKIVYKEKPIHKNTTYLKYKSNKKELSSKIHIAPNGKIYEIFETSTWVYFTWYNNTRKYFTWYDEAILLIDKVNKKNSLWIWNINSNSTFKDFLPSLLNNTENSLSWTIGLQTWNNILTYNDIIPYIVLKYWLSSDWKPAVNFKYIPKSSLNYNIFKTAYYYKMFGRNTNPNIKVRCWYFAVLLWLAEWWKVNYARNNVFESFYKKAIQKWYKFNLCCKSQYDYLNIQKKACILK